MAKTMMLDTKARIAAALIATAQIAGALVYYETQSNQPLWIGLDIVFAFSYLALVLWYQGARAASK